MEQEIIEGNKIIAEFMGWEFREVDDNIEAYYHTEYGSDLRWRDTKRFLKEILQSENGFSFNANWNKLMAAYKKLIDLINSGQIEHNMESSAIHDVLELEILKADILMAHKCFVQFIKWYNINK